MPYLMFDLAYWDDRVIGIAQKYGAQVIGGYAYDPHVADVGGWCGGWTPDVVRRIGQAGIAFMPIFTMKPATVVPLTPGHCVEVLKAYPLNSDLVGIDVETGSDPGQAYVQDWCKGLKAAGYRAVVYGSLTTIRSGYVSEASHTWGASYYAAVSATNGQISYKAGGQWFNASGLDPSAISADAFQYGGSVMVDGVEIDLSASNIPIGGSTFMALTDQQQADMAREVHDTRVMMDWVNVATDLVKTHLPAIEASQAAIEKAIRDASGHPADAPILAAVADAKSSIAAVQTAVAAIKAKTDKDLA